MRLSLPEPVAPRRPVLGGLVAALVARGLSPALALAIPLFTACDGPAGGLPAAVVRDSMGIELVTVSEAVLDALPVWSVAAEPFLSIGEVDGDAPYLFAGIGDRGVSVLDDGMVSIVDGGAVGTREIRVFDREGRFLRAIGRVGQGPGEFGSVPSTHRHPGGVLAFDGGLRRVTVFSPEGELVESWPISPECPYPQCVRLGALADGAVVVAFRDRVAVAEAPIGTRYDSVFAHFALAGREHVAELGTIASPPLAVYRGVSSAGGEIISTAIPLLSTIWDRRILPGQEHVIVQDPDRGELRIFDRTGLRRIVRLERTPVPLTPAQTRAVLDAREGLRFDDHAVLPTWPVLGDVRLGEGDDIWVADYTHELLTPSDAPRFYTIIGVDGLPVARLEMRPDPLVEDRRFATLARSTRDEVRVVTTDALDVRRVQFFAIEKER